MIPGSKKSQSNPQERVVSPEEQIAKINEIKSSLGQLSGILSIYCNDAEISRFLRARNWNVKKATKMLKDALKWRTEYKPEEIRWEDIAHEAQTGKIFRSNYVDKLGRTVLVMRPSRQNTKSVKGQVKFLVYCMENAILNLPQDQEQMVWLIDFDGFKLSNVSMGVTRETANVLQHQYPERLGVAVLYNPPKIFEPFFNMVKPFLEPKTAKKVNFVYSDDPNSKKIMEELFDIDQLDAAFGGKADASFEISKYAERMREDDKKIPLYWSGGNHSSVVAHPPLAAAVLDESDSDTSDKEKAVDSSPHEPDSVDSSPHEPDSVDSSPHEPDSVDPSPHEPDSVNSSDNN